MAVVHTDEEQKALTGTVNVSGESWSQTALHDRAQFVNGLLMSEVPTSAIEEVLGVRDEVAAAYAELECQKENVYARNQEHVVSAIGRWTDVMALPASDAEIQRLVDAQVGVLKRLDNWLDERKFTVVGHQYAKLTIPLFTFGAPNVAGCKVTYTRTEDVSTSADWSLSLFGTGFGGSNKIKVSVTSSFGAKDGQVKQVFINLVLPVAQVKVTEQNREIGTKYWVIASEAKPSGLPGLRLLPADTSVKIGDMIDQFPLALDASGNPTEYKYDYQQTGSLTLKLGVEAFNTKIEASVLSERTTGLTLDLELIGGHDYELHQVVDEDGIGWSPTT